jgi:hypothetical protein
MITIVTLAAATVATLAVIAVVMLRLLNRRRLYGIGHRSVADLGSVSQQWLNGHRTEPL